MSKSSIHILQSVIKINQQYSCFIDLAHYPIWWLTPNNSVFIDIFVLGCNRWLIIVPDTQHILLLLALYISREIDERLKNFLVQRSCSFLSRVKIKKSQSIQFMHNCLHLNTLLLEQTVYREIFVPNLFLLLFVSWRIED